MYQSNSYNDHVNIFKPNFLLGLIKLNILLKKKFFLNILEWDRRKKQMGNEKFSTEKKYWGFLANNDYAEFFDIGNWWISFIKLDVT